MSRNNNYYVYSPGYQSARANPPRKLGGHKILISFLIFAVLTGAYFLHANHTQAIANAREQAISQAAQEAAQRQKFVNSVQSVINQNPYIDISVSAINLSNNSTVQVGKSGAMNAASCGKMLTAALFLHQVENGDASLSSKLGGRSAQYQLQLLINQSDDNAWVLFNNKLTHPALLTYAQSLGLKSYDPDTDSISTSDMSVLMEKIYSEHLLNKTHTDLLLSYMQNTKYEDFIPPAVPAGYQIYHKVGFVEGEVNDSAVITNGSQKIVLSIFTNNSAQPDGSDTTAQVDAIQNITKSALKYL